MGRGPCGVVRGGGVISTSARLEAGEEDTLLLLSLLFCAADRGLYRLRPRCGGAASSLLFSLFLRCFLGAFFLFLLLLLLLLLESANR